MDLNKELEAFKKRIEKKGARVLALSVCVDGDGYPRTFAAGTVEMLDEMALVIMVGSRGLKITNK